MSTSLVRSSLNPLDAGFEPGEDTRQLIETPPRRAARAAGGSIAAFIFLCVAWSALAHVDIIVTASGVIVPADGTKVVQSLQAGTIQSVRVRDGQHVQAGEILVTLDATPYRAERDRVARELRLVRLEIARLESLLATRPEEAFRPPADATPEEVQFALTHLKSEVEQHRHTMAQLDSDLNQAQIALQRALEEERRAREQAEFLRQKATANEELLSRGLIAIQTATDTRHAAEDASREQRIKELALQELRAERDARHQRRQQEAERYRSDTLKALFEAQQKENRLIEDESKADFRLRNTTITSPVDGVVQQLAVHTVGGAVTEAAPLMTIVPSEGALHLNAWISNRDSGYVHREQRAQIKVDAFNFTHFGVWEGTVASVSSDAVSNRRMDALDETARFALNRAALQAGSDNSYYMASILLDPRPPAGSGNLTLRPGMTAQAEIIVGERRAIEYFLSPVTARLSRPFSAR
jgi:hemolysin D